MHSLPDLGAAVAAARRERHLKQRDVALAAGLAPESLSRFEHGRATDLGVRKLLAVLAVLGLELSIIRKGEAGSLDELRRERAGRP